jgi:Na+/phosphate symporter
MELTDILRYVSLGLLILAIISGLIIRSQYEHTAQQKDLAELPKKKAEAAAHLWRNIALALFFIAVLISAVGQAPLIR